jgi:hypothetical protein
MHFPPRVALGSFATLLLVGAALPRPARAQDAGAKTFFDYIRPTPITCPLTSKTWGTTGPCPSGDSPGVSPGCEVLPRDTCNGIESAVGAMTPPAYYYWDGKILRANDGTYHMFASSWSGSNGFNPGWTGSDPTHMISDGGLLGPYSRQGFVYDVPSFGGDPHHGHNTSAIVLNDGTYAVVVSEVVPFTIFTSSSLDGPWTSCPYPNPNTDSSGGHGGGLFANPNNVNTGYDGHWDSNVSVTARPDGKFEAVQRHGLIAIADSICGPYNFQHPTNAYPSNEQPSGVDSIYPNRRAHTDPLAGQSNGPPLTPENTYVLAEDPVIWYSGGMYHVLYDYPDDRVGYHLTSPDGISNWTDRGFAYDPRLAQQIFGYASSSTVNQWYKMERPGVYIENGHVAAVTWAVSDVDKNNQIPAGSNHGSKVIVVPFDGLALDCDILSDGGGCVMTEDGGAEAGERMEAGAPDATLGGAEDSGTNAGGSSSGGGGSDASRDGSGGGSTSSGGGASVGSEAGSSYSSGASSGGSSGSSGNGCGCVVGVGLPGASPAGALLAVFAAWIRTRSKRRRSRAPETVG